MLVACCASSQAGAWAQQQGKGLAIVNYRFYRTDTQFTAGGKRERMPNHGTFTKNEAELYLEYGIVNNLTFVGKFYFDFLNYQDSFTNNSNAGFADQATGLRWQFSARPVHQALELLVWWPAYNTANLPSLGNGYPSIDIRYYIGNEFRIGSMDGYWELGAGYVERFGPPSDQIVWSATAGFNLTRRLELNLHAKGIHGLGNNSTQFVGDNITITTDYQLVSLEPSLIFAFDYGWLVQAGPTIDIWGANTGAGLGLKAAVWKKF